MIKSECGYTIFYQTDNNLLPSMEQYQMKFKFEFAYPKDMPGLLFLIHISDINYSDSKLLESSGNKRSRGYTDATAWFI